MAITTFNEFSTTPASNIDVNGTSIQGTAPVSNFDNAFRELMAILRRDLDNGMVLTSKSAGYTAVANDNNAFICFSAAATLSLTAAATLGADWHCWVMADGGAVVIDPNSSETINGAATITIPDGATVLVICNGTNFRTTEDYTRFVQATVDVASATTTDIGASASWNVRITGTTTITGLGTVAEGTLRFVRMEGALTLTHNGTSLILPGSANITTAANDCFLAKSLGSGNWLVMFYQRASFIYSGWESYTPTFTGFGTVSAVSVFWKRVGDTLFLRGRFTCGTTTATEARMSLPSGLTSTSINGGVFYAGPMTFSLATAGTPNVLCENGVTYCTFGIQNASVGGFTKRNGTALGASGDVLTFNSVQIPIDGW